MERQIFIQGWTSFKSFIPESGVNISKEYYTFKDGGLYKHHVEQFDVDGKEINRNTFYNNGFAQSSITAVLNAEPSLIKIYNTLNYEGSQSRVHKYIADTDTGLSNIDTYNLENKEGWYVESITTDKQAGSKKEGKGFNYIKGEYGPTQANMTLVAKWLASQFSFQGLGVVLSTVDLGTANEDGFGEGSSNGASAEGTESGAINGTASGASGAAGEGTASSGGTEGGGSSGSGNGGY